MKPTYNWGIALSGGGIRGFAHLGALTALKEQGIEPDIISGTSIGSIVAAMYADGHTPESVYEMFKTIKLKDIATTNFFDHGGILKITPIQHLLEKHLHAKRFEDLRIPLRIIASDIEEGTAHCFSEGELIPAIIASCSIPIVFTPVEINGHYYVDGGVFDNFPVKCIRKECRKVIGINVSPITQMKYDKSLKYIIERTMNYMVGANTTEAIKLCDHYITVADLSNYYLLDTKGVNDLYQKGYEMVQSYLNQNQKTINKNKKNILSNNWFDRIKQH